MSSRATSRALNTALEFIYLFIALVMLIYYDMYRYEKLSSFIHAFLDQKYVRGVKKLRFAEPS